LQWRERRSVETAIDEAIRTCGRELGAVKVEVAASEKAAAEKRPGCGLAVVDRHNRPTTSS